MAQNLLVRGMNNMLLDAREDRLINEILTEGLFEPGDEFRVQQQGSPNMTVRVGSGSVGDRYVVEGPGGTYLVRNPDPWIGSGNGDLPIANGDPTFDRIDGIDLVVYDDSIDSSGMSKAEVVVTPGAPASVPTAPALPTGVAAVTRLATVLVEAGESTSITSGDITDHRTFSRTIIGAMDAARVDAGEARTSTSYGDLATPGPQVTVDTGRRAIVVLGANIDGVAGSAAGLMSFAVSGATTLAASDNNAVSTTTGAVERQANFLVLTGLNPGSNTFTAKYRKGSSGSSVTFAFRHIWVIPLP